MVQRVSGPGFHAPVVVTHEDQKDVAQEQIDEIGAVAGDWMVAEERSTTEAILSAARLRQGDPEALLLSLPCDHRIEDEVAFLRVVASAAKSAREGSAVSFGVAPKTAAPGKGVLRVEAFGAASMEVVALEDLSAEGFAEDMAAGAWLWNTGITLVKAGTLLQAGEEEAPGADQTHLLKQHGLVAFELDCGWSGGVGCAALTPVPNAAKRFEGEVVTRLSREEIDGWGYHETLSSGPRFQVRRMMVEPGAALPLQSHVHRSEHWVVVSGSARVTVAGDAKLLTENENVYIPLGVVHGLENPGKLPLHLIKVQSGCYLGEDDIIHHDDVRDCIEVA